jgi:hypothetical protein
VDNVRKLFFFVADDVAKTWLMKVFTKLTTVFYVSLSMKTGYIKLWRLSPKSLEGAAV